MKRTFLLAVPLAFAASMVLAQADGLPMIDDADGSGDWSLSELQTVWPDLTEDTFAVIDVDGNGAVDAAELQTALDNGVLIAPAE